MTKLINIEKLKVIKMMRYIVRSKREIEQSNNDYNKRFNSRQGILIIMQGGEKKECG